MHSPITNIVLSGVGGQGILLASGVISHTAMASGYDVKANEVHGMAQRGGSVIAQIRFGERVFSPLVKRGAADFLLALEKAEAIRYADYLRDDGIAIINMQRIIPVTVSSGLGNYPENIDDALSKRFPDAELLDCVAIAREIGNVRVANVVLIGMLSKHLPFDVETWKSVISEYVPNKALAANMIAFNTGRDAF